MRARILGLGVAMAGAAAAFVAWRLAGPHAASAAMAEARALAGANPLLSALGFALLYVAIAALAIPGVWAMSVAAGALFGPWVGLPVVVASSVAGATLTMLVARYALRDWVEARFPALVARFEEGVASGGARFLFAARVAPIVPFALINLAAGVTRMPARTFVLVSLVGVLPLSAVYVTTGAAIGAIGSPSEALTPGLVALLAALAVAPFAAKALARRPLPFRRGA